VLPGIEIIVAVFVEGEEPGARTPRLAARRPSPLLEAPARSLPRSCCRGPDRLRSNSMRLALLGIDAECLLLAQSALQSGHSIVWKGDAPSLAVSPPPGIPAADRAADWQELCDPHTCDAILVGRGTVPPESIVGRLLQLLKSGRAVLTSFPIVDALLPYYEIDLARGDGRAVLHHFNPLVTQSEQIARIAELVRTGHPQIGPLEQLWWDRPLEDRSQSEVLYHFARDVELLDQLAGPLDRLGAVGSPDAAATYAGLSVQLLGKTPVPVRWSVGPNDVSLLPTLTLVGRLGRLRFEVSAEGTFTPAWENTEIHLPPATGSAAERCLRRFHDAVSNNREPTSTWPAALRAMELADTIEISLRRGRMIDVHRQQLTEELSFRGTMSAVGCGLLVVMLPLLLVAGWLAEKLGFSLAPYWAHALLVLLAVFLLFQFAPRLMGKAESQQHSLGDSEQTNR
jgi:hypothetical protein